MSYNIIQLDTTKFDLLDISFGEDRISFKVLPGTSSVDDIKALAANAAIKEYDTQNTEIADYSEYDSFVSADEILSATDNGNETIVVLVMSKTPVDTRVEQNAANIDYIATVSNIELSAEEE